jgi:hypothetical protein
MTKKNTVLEGVYQSKDAVNGSYRTLFINSAEYDSGRMEGFLVPSGSMKPHDLEFALSDA